MSVLATEADIKARYPREYAQLCKNLSSLGCEDSSVPIASALATASTEVILYAQQGDIEHPLLTQLTVDVALYRACATGAISTKEIRQRFDDARASLGHIATGKIKLTEEEDVSPNSHATFFARKRLFSRDTDI